MTPTFVASFQHKYPLILKPHIQVDRRHRHRVFTTELVSLLPHLLLLDSIFWSHNTVCLTLYTICEHVLIFQLSTGLIINLGDQKLQLIFVYRKQPALNMYI